MTIAALLLLAALVGGTWLWTPDLARADLEAKYAAAPSRFIDAAGLRLHVRDTGPIDGTGNPPTLAPTLILLHGFGSSLHTWEPWAEVLQASHRVIRIDLPGAGLTGPDRSTAEGDYSDVRGMRIVTALMDTLGVPRATVIGHSMGGRLAWRLAAEHPERVDKLVLVAPDGFASPGFEYGRAPDVPWAAQLMRHVLPKLLLRKSLEPAYADPTRISDATVTRYHDMMLAPGVREALLARMGQLVLQDPVSALQRIRAPTLLLWGAQDAMIPPAHAQDYLRALPNARLVTVPGVGHVPHEEAPAASLPAVQAFLAEPAGPL